MRMILTSEDTITSDGTDLVIEVLGPEDNRAGGVSAFLVRLTWEDEGSGESIDVRFPLKAMETVVKRIDMFKTAAASAASSRPKNDG